MRTGRARRAFSLIELLVVIGIIGLLLGLLLPAMARAREQAKTLVCLSNLRQIGQAIYSYASDNRGLLPAWSAVHFYPDDPPYQDNPNSADYAGPGWPVLLARYVGQKPDGRIYQCPGFPPEAQPGVNYFISARWMYVQRPLLRTMPFSRIKQSSKFILSGDCTAAEYYPAAFGTGAADARDDIDKDDGAIRCLVFFGEPGGYNAHRAGNAVLFADGHAATFKSFDPAQMTHSPHGDATWESVRSE
jgi:prepilin-type N-terminal cleavage/methylation domain-containing protein/prepilin-type processing-associated H-X9-DG protein